MPRVTKGRGLSHSGVLGAFRSPKGGRSEPVLGESLHNGPSLTLFCETAYDSLSQSDSFFVQAVDGERRIPMILRP